MNDNKDPKFIVLDIDATLLSTSDRKVDDIKSLGIMNNPNLKKRLYRLHIPDIDDLRGSGDNYDSFGLLRPYVNEFIKFCFDHFELVIIWSAGCPKYIQTAIDNIFRDSPHPQLVYTFNECRENEETEEYYKNLACLVNEKIAQDHKVSLKNTFVVDDNESTLVRNPKNGILIPAYQPDFNSKEKLAKDNDQRLLQLIKWFEKPGILNCSDVTGLDKSKISDKTRRFNDF